MNTGKLLFHNFIGFVVILGIIFSGVLDRFIPYNKFYATPNEITESMPDSVKEKFEKAEENDSQNYSEGMLTRFFSRALARALKTPQGQKLIGNMLEGGQSLMKMHSETNFKYGNFGLINEQFKIYTLRKGSGRVTQCGDKVKIQYKITENYDGLPNFVEASDSKDKTSDNQEDDHKEESLYLGDRKLGVAEENIIVGMKPGEVRYGELRNIRGNSDSQKSYPKFWVKLVDSQPGGDEIETKKLEVFEDSLSSEMPLICGNKVKFNLTIHRFDGETIMDTTDNEKAMEITIGSSEYPYRLSRFLYGKFRIGRRVVITPGKNLMDISKYSKFQNISLNPEEFYMLKISDAELLE